MAAVSIDDSQTIAQQERPVPRTSRKTKRRRPTAFVHDKSAHRAARRRWRTWLPKMGIDLAYLIGKKEIFWGLQEIAKENPSVLQPGAYFEWQCNNYFAAVVMEIRGFVDQSYPRSRSLWWLLYEILENPGAISRAAHRSLYRGTSLNPHFDIANLTFDNVVGKRKQVLGQNAIRGDLRRLEDATARIHRFGNKRIAHRTPAGDLRELPKIHHIDDAIKTIDETYCKYNLLLTAHSPDSMEATRQYDWMEALHEAWVNQGSRFRPGED